MRPRDPRNAAPRRVWLSVDELARLMTSADDGKARRDTAPPAAAAAAARMPETPPASPDGTA